MKLDEPKGKCTTLDVINQLQITALTVAVIVMWLLEIKPRREIEKQVQSTERKVDAIDKALIKHFGEKQWQEMQNQ